MLGHEYAVACENLLLVPRALADELLQCLLGVLTLKIRRERDSAGQGLDALALTIEQKSLEVHASPACGLGLRKVRCEACRVLAESFQNCRIELWCEGLHNPLERRIPFHDSPF